MKVLLHPVYLPNIEHFTAMLKSDWIEFEAFDNFQKQTYRNRSYIYAANGKLQLNVPVKHSQNNRQLYKDVKIGHETDWKLVHKRSIESAYRTSPFFEFYQDEILPIFSNKETFLCDFNLKCIEILFDCLQLPFHFSQSEEFKVKPLDKMDCRYLADAKRKNETQFESYSQVFDQKHGFINNLSVIDLICNLGPNSTDYIKRQQLIKFST